MLVVTAQQMQRLDHRTIHEAGIPGIVLMENAGRGTAAQIERLFPDVRDRRVVVLSGKGNNGGDGFVIARCLLDTGCTVSCLLIGQAEQVSGDARIMLHAYQQAGGSLQVIADAEQWQHAADSLQHAGLIIDALLGTGLSGAVAGLHQRIIQDVNCLQGIPVVSVDVPSGVDATTGKILGAAIRAQLTCTLGLPKLGLVLFPGAAHAGSLEVIDIGIPRSLVAQEHTAAGLLEQQDFKGLIPARLPESHKGTYGHVCILAGSPGKTGAAALASQAAMRTGAGLVTLGIPQQLNPILEAKLTEVMTEPLPDAGDGYLGLESWPRIQELIAGKSVIALGPGLAVRTETARLVHKIVAAARAPLIIDADGLNAIAQDAAFLKGLSVPAVLTPHPGEMARLAGISTQAVQEDRPGQASAFAVRHGVIVVLKGSRTIIAEPDGTISINPTGNPGMASGGMGDVLTGIIAGLLSQGLSASAAARLGVFVHGLLGDRIAREQGPVGIMATDLLAGIPAALSAFVAQPCR
jgi:NAD(P)H-hydrate epimerase